MDHRHIEEHNIADRYLLDKLTVEERARFEEHFIDCQECLDQLTVTGSWRAALKSVAATDAARPPVLVPTGFIGWLTQLQAGWRAALVASAAALLILPAILSVGEIRRLRHELDQVKMTVPELRPPEAAPPDAGRAQEDQTGPVGPSTQVPPPPAPDSRAALQPQINMPIFALSAVRSADPNSFEVVNDIDIPRSSLWVVFSLELVGGPKYDEYRASIWTASRRLHWRQSGLRPNHYDALTIGLPSNFLPVGRYLLTLEGLPAQGQPVSVANYPFRVTRKQ